MWNRFLPFLLLLSLTAQAQTITGERGRGRVSAGVAATAIRIAAESEIFDYTNASNNGTDVDTDDFSVSLWFAWDTGTNSCIMGNHDQTAAAGWALYKGGSAFLFRVTGTSGTHVNHNLGTSPAAGTWWHVACVVDRTADTGNCWVNGVADDDNPKDLSGITGEDFDRDANNLEIFRCNTSSTDSDARVGPTGLWVGTKLDSGDVTALYNSGVPILQADLSGAGVPAATAYWDMTAAANTDETDQTGNGFTMDDNGANIDASTKVFP